MSITDIKFVLENLPRIKKADPRTVEYLKLAPAHVQAFGVAFIDVWCDSDEFDQFRSLRFYSEKTVDGETGEIKNLDLVKSLYQMKRINEDIKFKWVRGHSGVYWNEYVDQKCTGLMRA